MELDRDTCLKASASRDARFDGRFFIGVRTTGIYCRPICPAPSPRPENVVFYPTAAAASEAGLRPCRRCRPETAPGTPEWLGGPAVVTRGLRLVADGYLDRHDVPDLARELCVGERQLRRLFEAYLGASPAAVARTRRAQLARQLIDETDLTMTEIAGASGFPSTRRFNEAVRRTFGRTPTELRRARRGAAPAGLELRLPYRPPLAWGDLVGFLGARAIPGLEVVEGSTYRRVARAGDENVVVEVDHAPPVVLVRVGCGHLDRLASIVALSRGAFDLDADPAAIGAALGDDPAVGPLVRARPGLRIPGAWDGFELGVRAVLGQQVSVAGARTLAGRLVARYGEALPEPAGGLTHAFPAAAVLMDARVEEIGLPRARAETIRRLARAVAGGEIDLSASAPFAETRQRLHALPGIGDWTVEYVAMRALRDPDAFPAGDLGLRRALGLGTAEAADLAEGWRPWRAYAALHLWVAPPDEARRAA